MSAALSPSRTIVYAHHQVDLQLDIYENAASKSGLSAPAFLFFHGGGLSYGDRTLWLPQTLIKDAVERGWRFFSADYRLVPSATARQVFEDAVAAMDYVAAMSEVDARRICVGGISAGGYLAQLASIFARAKPAALFISCGLAMRFLTPFWLQRWQNDNEPLEPSDYPDMMPPACFSLPPLAGSKPMIREDGKPDGRTIGCPLYRQQGIWHSVIFQQLGLSDALREAKDDPARVLTADQRALFPELHDASQLPPTFLLHGEADNVVPMNDAIAFADRLTKAGVPVKLRTMPGLGHAAELAPQHAHYQDGCVAWLAEAMERR